MAGQPRCASNSKEGEGAERLIRTTKEEGIALSDREDYNDAISQLGRFLSDVYIHKRIHTSLGYFTPAEFEERWRGERVEPETMFSNELLGIV